MEVGSDGRYAHFRVLFSLFLLHLANGCQDSAVGIADSSIIPDNRFTASSDFGNADDTRYLPKNARLNGAAKGWGPKTNDDANDYLQIDLGQLFVICAVATQGCSDCSERTTEYKISISVDNNIWTTYKTGGADKLFPGNTDSNTVVKNVLDYPVTLRHIRFIPTTYNSHKVLRVEAYGVRRDLLCGSLPVGIGSGRVPDSDMTASSSYNSTTSPSKARLNYTAGSSWCAATSDSSPYLQIDLGSPYIICGIAAQGDHMTWVQSYNMLTSNDGSTFTKYMENSQIMSFPGNFDTDTAVKNLFFDGTVGQYMRVAPTSHYGSTNCMRTELYGIKRSEGCTNMFVGISSPSIIPDHRFTASSEYGDGKYKASNARLMANTAWAPRTKSGEWLQIDLGSVMFVCAVATQGSGYRVREWAKEYKIEVSVDNVNWNYYQENNVEKTFSGNTNWDGVVTNSLAHPVKAKFLRFYPTDYNKHPTMRVEVYGISSACSAPVGLEAPGSNQMIQMTASSQVDGHTASHGRLYGNSAWCSSTLSNTEYLQIDLGQAMTVTAIATQGDNITDKWVETYTISYSMDGNLWNTYKAGGNSVKIFQGNSDKGTILVRWPSLPVTARHIRVNPKTWNTGICMRIELYGCDYATRPVITGLTNENLTAAANSYVDLVCIVQDPLIQYIKWYTGNTDITSQSTGLVRGADGVKQSTLRVNYTSDDDVVSTYDCFRSGPSLLCYKPFTCRAMYGATKINADGIKSAGVRVRFDYPSLLPQPTVTILSSTAVRIEWKKPTLNEYQKPVSSYMLVYQKGSYSKKITVNSPSLSQDITGLEIYTRYNITMKAVSIVGDGQWSQPKQFRTASDIPSGFPTLIKVEALSSQSIRVTWKAPTSGINGPFLGYKVFCISDRHESTATLQQTSHTFTGLRKWTVYNVTVVIRNDKGDGPINDYVIRRTLEDAPTQPRNVQVTVESSTSVRLDWALPSEVNGIIRGFKVRYEKAGSLSEKDLPGNTTLPHVLTGLDKCTQYSFKMLAYTIKDGPYTAVVQKTTDEDAPSVPTNLVANIIKLNGPSVPNVTLTWRKPVVCGDNVRYYYLTYSHSEDPTLMEYINTTKLTETIPVWGGVTYGFRVRGVTNKEGPDTPKKAVAVPVYAPSDSPSNLIFGNVNKTTFKVSWNEIPRSKSNGRVIAYEVSQTLVRRGRARRSIDAVGQVKLMNSSCCSLYLHDLLVCAEYQISIKGYTSAGAGPSSGVKPLKTSVPGSPVHLLVQKTTKREITLSWQKPASVTETVDTYTIAYEGKKAYNTSFVHIGSLLASSTSKEVTNLYPGTRYTFKVSATTACGKGDNSSPVSSNTKVDAPPAPAVELVVNITAEVNAITVWESSDTNGQIVAYQFIVVDGNSSIDYTKMKSYEEAKKEELQYYISAELKTVPGKTFPRIFILGDEKEYNGYKNVKISYGKTFNVLQRALTQDDNKNFLAGPSSLIARGKISENKESSSGKHLQKDTACVGLDFSVFAVSLALNVAFIIGIVLIAVHNRRLKKQLDKPKKVKSRPVTAYTQDVYANIPNSSGEELAMTPLPTQERCTYEQIDLHGTVDPSDVQTEVTAQNAIAVDEIGGIYESITEESKPNPNAQIYDTIETETKAENPEQMTNDKVSSSQPIYQPLAQENQTVYESLHT